MKKTAIFLTVFCLMLSFCACGKTEDKMKEESKDAVQTVEDGSRYGGSHKRRKRRSIGRVKADV